MKIAIVRSFYAPAKIKSYNSQEIGLAQALIRKGVSVDIYSRFIGITRPIVYDTGGEAILRLIPLKGIIFYKIAYFPKLLPLLKEGEYDVIQVHGDQNLMTPLIMKENFKNYPIKTLYQGMYAKNRGLGKIYNFLFDKFFLSSIQKNVDISLAKTREACLFLEQKSYNDVYLQPIGLNFDQMIENDSRNEEVECFIKKFESTLLYIGIVEPRRDLLFILDVLKALVKKAGHISYGFVLVGQGPSLSVVKDKVKSLSLENNVLFIDTMPNDEIGSIYKVCDMFLLPSHYEIYGMVVMEALLFGIPVISSPTAGPSDILTDKFLGEIVDFNVKEWCDIILKYGSSKYSRPEYKEQRRDFILSNYSWDHLATRYLDLVRNYKKNN